MTASITFFPDHLRVPVVQCIGPFCVTRKKNVPFRDIQRAYTDRKGRVFVRVEGINKRIFVKNTTIADFANQVEHAKVALFEHPKKKNALFNPGRKENYKLLEKWQEQQNPACALI